MPTNVVLPTGPGGPRRLSDITTTTAPEPIAVDLGSATLGVWAAHRGIVSNTYADLPFLAAPPMRRGRLLRVDDCVAALTDLIRRYDDPVPARGVVVACRPVLSTDVHLTAVRQVLQEVLAPSRILFVDTVRAAAIGSGAAAGTLLIADIGAQLTEVALLHHGRVVAARRADIGTQDLSGTVTADLISRRVAHLVHDLRTDPAASALPAALTRGVLLVGDGAAHPDLTRALARRLGTRLHHAAAPRTAALTGAALAATSLLRHPALETS